MQTALKLKHAVHVGALCQFSHKKSQQNKDGQLCQNMVVNGHIFLQMSLFSHKMKLCLTAPGRKQYSLVGWNQEVSWPQLVLYMVIYHLVQFIFKAVPLHIAF